MSSKIQINIQHDNDAVLTDLMGHPSLMNWLMALTDLGANISLKMRGAAYHFKKVTDPHESPATDDDVHPLLEEFMKTKKQGSQQSWLNL